MKRALVIAGLVASAPVAVALSSSAWAQAPAAPANKCAEDTPQKKAKRSMFGGLLGSIADNALGRAGISTSVVGVHIPVGSLLSDAIINLLDCKEQQQAAKATDEAIRGGVGTEVAWKSETRANVSGKSKVTGQEQLADGSQCVTVNDVVIVDGEETTVPKRMCRRPGASGYARV
jgi:surface antigen